MRRARVGWIGAWVQGKPTEKQVLDLAAAAMRVEPSYYRGDTTMVWATSFVGDLDPFAENEEEVYDAAIAKWHERFEKGGIERLRAIAALALGVLEDNLGEAEYHHVYFGLLEELGYTLQKPEVEAKAAWVARLEENRKRDEERQRAAEKAHFEEAREAAEADAAAEAEAEAAAIADADGEVADA